MKSDISLTELFLSGRLKVEATHWESLAFYSFLVLMNLPTSFLRLGLCVLVLEKAFVTYCKNKLFNKDSNELFNA